MTSPAHDLDRYADDRLDGEIDDATWQTLTAEHGNALAIALQQATTRRAAVAELPQPPLPVALRAKLLPPTAAPAPLRFPWRAAIATTIAAGLLIAVLPRFHTADTERPQPVVAREERQVESSPSAKSRAADADAAGPSAAFVAAEPEHQAPSDEQVIAALADTARANVDSDRTTATAVSMEMEEASVGPHGIALAWAPRRNDADGRIASGRSRDLREQRRSAAPAGLDAEGLTPAPAAAAPEAAAPMAVQERPAESLASAQVSSPDTVVVVLHNRTVSPWTIAADQLRLEARDANDAVVWHGRVDAIGSLTVEPGGFLSLTIATADWPAATQTLRATLGDLSSSALPLVPTAD